MAQMGGQGEVGELRVGTSNIRGALHPPTPPCSRLAKRHHPLGLHPRSHPVTAQPCPRCRPLPTHHAHRGQEPPPGTSPPVPPPPLIAQLPPSRRAGPSLGALCFHLAYGAALPAGGVCWRPGWARSRSGTQGASGSSDLSSAALPPCCRLRPALAASGEGWGPRYAVPCPPVLGTVPTPHPGMGGSRLAPPSPELGH